MARFRTTDAAAGQSVFLPINLSKQLIPGTFEAMLDEIIGTTIDLSVFNNNYSNDLTGAPAVPPEVLLKLIIYGYYKGYISSRKIQSLNDENIIAKALTGDMQIHFTTIADFVSSNTEHIAGIFTQVLAYCNELGLIGGETFASDGLRLPSNASIDMSGTEEELKKRLCTYEKMAEKHVKRHKRKDAEGAVDEETQKLFDQRQKELNQKKAKLIDFLANMEKKVGQSGQEIKSNVTDNDSATIKSPKGFIQGYIGIAVSDAANQVIVCAEAVGTANEGEHLPGLLDQTLENLEEAGVVLEEEAVFLADANYHSEDNLSACAERGVEPIIPDCQEKRRVDPNGQPCYTPDDFKYNEADNSYECPNGKKLEYKRTVNRRNGESKEYEADVKDCKECSDFSRCSRSRKEQGLQKKGKTLGISRSSEPNSLSRQMRKKLDTEEYKDKYSRRIQIAEPVFSNISYCKGLNRFTLRGKSKVNAQWLLYCMVHNLGKCLNGRNKREEAA